MAAERDGVSVLIVNFNSARHLTACLGSMSAGHAGPWRAVIVDNSPGAPDFPQELLATQGVTLIVNRHNAGFARALNQAARACNSPWLLLVNPDCRVLPGAVATLRAQLESDARCAAAGPMLVAGDGTLQGSARSDPTLLTGLFGRSTLLARLFPSSRLARREVLDGDAVASGRASTEVDWVCGACMLVRREAFEALGGFDERFFLYWEDADFCRRARNAGWRIAYVPAARATHEGGESSRTVRELALRAFHRSAYTYVTTHIAQSRLHPLRPVARLLLGARCRLALFRMKQRGPTPGVLAAPRATEP